MKYYKINGKTYVDKSYVDKGVDETLEDLKTPEEEKLSLCLRNILPLVLGGIAGFTVGLVIIFLIQFFS